MRTLWRFINRRITWRWWCRVFHDVYTDSDGDCLICLWDGWDPMPAKEAA